MFKNIHTAQGKQLLHQPLNPRQAAESKRAATQGECTLTQWTPPPSGERLRRSGFATSCVNKSSPHTVRRLCLRHKHPKKHSLKECMEESEKILCEHSWVHLLQYAGQGGDWSKPVTPLEHRAHPPHYPQPAHWLWSSQSVVLQKVAEWSQRPPSTATGKWAPALQCWHYSSEGSCSL